MCLLVRKQWGLILFCLPLYAMEQVKLPQSQEVEQSSPLCDVSDNALSIICRGLERYEIGMLHLTCKSLDRRLWVPRKKIRINLFKRLDISPYIDGPPIFPIEPALVLNKALSVIQAIVARNSHNPIYLELGCNNLVAYPELLSEFLVCCSSTAIVTYIRGLSLGGNMITHVPTELTGLTHLKSLNLEWNTVDQDSLRLLARMTSLRHLSLKNNQLSALPPKSLGLLAPMTSLRHLNVALNDLSVLPDEISQLTNIKNIEINSNRLSIAAIKPLFLLKNLTDLDVSGNQPLVCRKLLEVLRQKTWPLLKEIGVIGLDITDEDYRIPLLQGVKIIW